MFFADFNVNDGLDEIRMTNELDAGLSCLNVPRPDILVPGAGKDGLVVCAAYCDAGDGCRRSFIGFSVLILRFDMSILNG